MNEASAQGQCGNEFFSPLSAKGKMRNGNPWFYDIKLEGRRHNRAGHYVNLRRNRIPDSCMMR